MTAIPIEKLEGSCSAGRKSRPSSTAASSRPTYAQLSKEFADLDPVVATIRALRKAEAERRDLASIVGRPRRRQGLQGAGAARNSPALERRVARA